MREMYNKPEIPEIERKKDVERNKREIERPERAGGTNLVLEWSTIHEHTNPLSTRATIAEEVDDLPCSSHLAGSQLVSHTGGVSV